MIALAEGPASLLVIFLVSLAAAAAVDVWRRQVPNTAVLAVALSGIGAFAMTGNWELLWQPLLVAIAIIAVGVPLFARQWAGGGDIKLLAACALWFDLSSGWKLLVAIAIAGGIETLTVLGLRRLPWSEGARKRALLLRRGGDIPYGVAIALGVALMAYWLRR